jgi:hypothetical protein
VQCKCDASCYVTSNAKLKALHECFSQKCNTECL